MGEASLGGAGGGLSAGVGAEGDAGRGGASRAEEGAAAAARSREEDGGCAAGQRTVPSGARGALGLVGRDDEDSPV